MKTIVIDPGHGGKDRYNRGFSGKYIEADGNLEFSLFLKEELQDFFNVILTREKDETLTLTERGKIAIRNNADIFISVHSDAYSNNSSGVTVFDSVDLNNTDIAEKIGDACANAMGISFRGHKERESEKYPNEDYYTVIDTAQDGGIEVVLLIERGFHSNPNEEKLLLDSAVVQKSAKAVADEIKKYFGVKENILKVNFLGKKIKIRDYMLKNKKNYVQIRELFEQIGFNVMWDNDDKIIKIKLK